jgi:hypothetical protein
MVKTVAICAGAVLLALDWSSQSIAAQPGSVYQRRAFEGGSYSGGGHDSRSGAKFNHFAAPAPQVNANWFQRPYPYHLDYYRMRYGGSYAPYFGNLYGPPQVVTAPPYFGPYGQFYGGFGGGFGGDGLPPQNSAGSYWPGPGWCPCPTESATTESAASAATMTPPPAAGGN